MYLWINTTTGYLTHATQALHQYHVLTIQLGNFFTELGPTIFLPEPLGYYKYFNTVAVARKILEMDS